MKALVIGGLRRQLESVAAAGYDVTWLIAQDALLADVVKLPVRRLYAFPRGRSRADLGPGLAASREGDARWTLKLRGPPRRYRLRASLATLRDPFRPCRVMLGGGPLARRAWSFSARTRVLKARFRARAERLVVQGCSRPG